MWGNNVGCLTYDGLCPEWDVVGVALEWPSVGHAEQQASLGIVNGVIVNIHTVSNSRHALAVEYRLLVARDNLVNRYVVAAFHHSLGNTRSIDSGVSSR